MDNRLIVIGASAGGVTALRRLVADLSPDLAAPVLIVLHLAPAGPSRLAEILTRAGPLAAEVASEDEELVVGRIYVAPPDFHLVVREGRCGLSAAARENGHRPAVDTLFRSAAASRGSAVIGVLLTGLLDDGTSGALAIKDVGGTLIVQHPDDAEYPDMPRSALRHVAADHVVPLAAIGPLLARIANASVPTAASWTFLADPERPLLTKGGRFFP